MRVVVVEPPPPGARGLGRSPLAVGAFDWLDPTPIVTVVVKVSYSFAGGALSLAAAQAPLTVIADPATDLHDPWDLAPFKPEVDVILLGHACAEPGRRRREIPVRFSVGPVERAVLARSDEDTDRIPLHGGGLFTADGAHPERVGPARVPADLVERRAFPESFAYAAFQVAPPEQRCKQLDPGTPIRLEGVSPQGPIELTVPLAAPRVRIDWRTRLPPAELQIFADTLVLDVDRERMILGYRGILGTPRPGCVQRVMVALEPAGEQAERRPWPEILRSAVRGSFSLGAAPGEAGGPPADDPERHRVAMARADLLSGELPPEPALPLDAYARIGAELAEQRAPRAEVLKRHDLDDLSWTLEERAWLGAMAEGAAHRDTALTIAYGDRFVAAQDALALPAEADHTFEDWASIAAAVERSGGDPTPALERRGIRFAEWLRLDRRAQRAARADQATADDLARLLAEARARGGPSEGEGAGGEA